MKIISKENILFNLKIFTCTVAPLFQLNYPSSIPFDDSPKLFSSSVDVVNFRVEFSKLIYEIWMRYSKPK